MRSIVFALMMLFASSGWCGDGFVSGKYLYDNLDSSFFVGYVTSVADVMSTNTPYGIKACLPYLEMQNGQVVAVAKKYLNDHPESLHHSGASLVAIALHEAFPCN